MSELRPEKQCVAPTELKFHCGKCGGYGPTCTDARHNQTIEQYEKWLRSEKVKKKAAFFIDNETLETPAEDIWDKIIKSILA